LKQDKPLGVALLVSLGGAAGDGGAGEAPDFDAEGGEFGDHPVDDALGVGLGEDAGVEEGGRL
jgi:hypothetical protein